MSFYERTVRGALRAYKLTLSPMIGRQCRFLPTCSGYAAQALIQHGPWRRSRPAVIPGAATGTTRSRRRAPGPRRPGRGVKDQGPMIDLQFPDGATRAFAA